MLGVLPHKMLKGCSTLVGDENLAHFQNNCQGIYDLKTMLDTPFRTDAHFTSYNITGLKAWPRLNKTILQEIRGEGADIVLAYFTFDWDNAGHAEWDRENMTHFGNLISTCQDPIINSWCGFYTTKHGARLIYKLSQPVPVDTAEQNLSWMFHHFKEHGFDLIDEGCKDWTRLMRCPRVVRDNVPTWEQPYFKHMYREECTLDISAVGKMGTKTVAKKTYFSKDKQEQPDHAELESILRVTNPTTGKGKFTEYFKRAKRLLKDSPYFDTLFNSAMPGWGQGSRNEEICKMLGIITPILLKNANASVTQVFALAVQPLLSLDVDQDWVAHGWNALLDIYEREINKYNHEKEERAVKATAEAKTLDLMVEGMSTWCDNSILQCDEEQARLFVKENCLASVRGYFYMMGEDGFFDPMAITKEQLISRIRKTYLQDIIPTKKTNYAGETVDVPTNSIQNEYSTPVGEVKMKPVGDMGGHIEDINGKKPALVLSTFARNTLLEPTYNAYVNEWLFHLFGEKYFEIGCAWIGNALAFEEGLICALSLEGASSAGKKLLSIGLSECLVEHHVATSDDIYGQSGAFMRTPFLVVDESWPSGIGKASPADKFKSLTGGDGITVNEKFMPQIRILCPIRMILTANDDGIVRALMKGKDMGLDNRTAVGERLFHIKVSKKASHYLHTIGGRGFTGRKGQRWIRPDSGSESSDFIVAKHFLWLYENRKPVDPSQRFLVMGNCAPGAGEGDITVLDRILSQSNDTPQAIEAIIGMVDSTNGQWDTFMRYDAELTQLWVTRYGVHKFAKDILEERLTEAEIFGGMQPLLARTEPEEMDHMNWYEINMDIIAKAATEMGKQVSRVRVFVMNRVEKGLRYE